MGAIACVGDGVNHCAPVAVCRRHCFGILNRCVICASALAAKAANGCKAGGVFKAECLMWVCHLVSFHVMCYE